MGRDEGVAAQQREGRTAAAVRDEDTARGRRAPDGDSEEGGVGCRATSRAAAKREEQSDLVVKRRRLQHRTADAQQKGHRKRTAQGGQHLLLTLVVGIAAAAAAAAAAATAAAATRPVEPRRIPVLLECGEQCLAEALLKEDLQLAVRLVEPLEDRGHARLVKGDLVWGARRAIHRVTPRLWAAPVRIQRKGHDQRHLRRRRRERAHKRASRGREGRARGVPQTEAAPHRRVRPVGADEEVHWGSDYRRRRRWRWAWVESQRRRARVVILLGGIARVRVLSARRRRRQGRKRRREGVDAAAVIGADALVREGVMDWDAQ